MKTSAVALAIVLAGCALGASAAQAAQPKTGTWTVKLDGAPTPPRGQKSGQLTVISKKGKLFVQVINAPSHFVKCTGTAAQPEEMNPGFDGQFGLGGPYKVSKKGKFSGSSRSGTRVQSFTGKFTSKRKASGTLRVRIGDKRSCDSGPVKWRASR